MIKNNPQLEPQWFGVSFEQTIYQLFISVYARALLNTGEAQKALELFKQVIEEMKTISQMIRHKIFYDKALMFENKIYQNSFQDIGFAPPLGARQMVGEICEKQDEIKSNDG